MSFLGLAGINVLCYCLNKPGLAGQVATRAHGGAPRVRVGFWNAWSNRIFYHHSCFPNGVIRYNPHKLTYSSFQISGNMMLIWFVVGSFISYEVLTFDEIHWPKLYQTASWHAWYTHWKRYGITPDLNDHSYGAWNYYPMTRKGIVYR